MIVSPDAAASDGGAASPATGAPTTAAASILLCMGTLLVRSAGDPCTATGGSRGAAGGRSALVRAALDGHQTLSAELLSTSAGTSSERTMNVSSSTPKAIVKPISVRNTSGSTASTENVPASTMPADVMTPPVTASPRSMPSRVPCVSASSRTRAIRKML